MSKDYYQAVKEINKKPERQAYVKGRAFEKYCIKIYRNAGWYVKRSFGSKGEEDFVAFLGFYHSEANASLGTCHFVQCKWSKSHETKPEDFAFEMQDLIAKAQRFGAIPVFAGVKKQKRNRVYFVNLFNGLEMKIG